MSCSDELVSKDYLEQRLAELQIAIQQSSDSNVSQALIREREINFSSIFGALQTLLQAFIDGWAVQLALVSDLLGSLSNFVRGLGEKVENLVQGLDSHEIRIFALEEIVRLQQQQIDSLEQSQAVTNEKINQVNIDIASLRRRDLELASEIDSLRSNVERAFAEIRSVLQTIQRNFELIEKEINDINALNRRQEDRLNFIDESFRELDLILRTLYQNFAETSIDLALSIAENTRDIYDLQQALANLPQLPPTQLPQFTPPSVRSYPAQGGVVVEVSTEGGTDAALIPIPEPPPIPSLVPSVDLRRNGQTLTLEVAIAGNSATDSETLPDAVIEETYRFIDLIQEQVDISRLEAQAQQLLDQNNLITATLMTAVINSNQILTQTDPNALRAAAAGGTCDSLNGGCGQNFRNQIRDDAGDLLTPINTAILGNNAAGIVGMQQRLNTLYNRLGVDRMMHALNIALGVHNAVAVSRAVGQTLGYVVDATAQAAGFQWTDTQGNQISFSQVFGANAVGFVQNVIGADLYNNLNANFNKLLRVYQTGQNVAWAVRGIIDPIRSATDIITENTGKIGNALRRSGAVLENSYQIMPERATLQSATEKKIETFTASVQDIGEGLETFGELSENVIEIQENTQQLQESSTAFDNEIENITDQKEADNTASNFASQSPVITLADLVPTKITTP